MFIKKCRYCGQRFEPEHGNQAYCKPEHRAEARQIKLRMRLGTDTFGSHRNNKFQTESKLVAKQKRNILGNKLNRGRWHDKRESGDYNAYSRPARVQVTHIYARRDDYDRAGIDSIRYRVHSPCEDCGKANFAVDLARCEVVCRNCGLVKV